jgi:hypothetical protein
MGIVESYLMDAGPIGYEVLDTIVQANVNIEQLSLEDIERIIRQCASQSSRHTRLD